MRIRFPNTGKKKSSCYLGEGGKDVDQVQTLPDSASGPTTVQPSPHSPDCAVVDATEKSSPTGKSQRDERFGPKGPAWTKFFRRGDAGGARTSNDNTHRRDTKIDIEWPFADDDTTTSCTEKADVEQSTPSHVEEGSQAQAVLWVRDILVRIRIRGSVPLTYGSGSCFFRLWLTRCQQKK